MALVLTREIAEQHISNWADWQRSINHPAPSVNCYATQPFYSPERVGFDVVDDRRDPDVDLAKVTEDILTTLPEHYFRILEWYWLHSLPRADIAKRLRCTTRTVSRNKVAAMDLYIARFERFKIAA